MSEAAGISSPNCTARREFDHAGTAEWITADQAAEGSDIDRAPRLAEIADRFENSPAYRIMKVRWPQVRDAVGKRVVADDLSKKSSLEGLVMRHLTHDAHHWV